MIFGRLMALGSFGGKRAFVRCVYVLLALILADIYFVIEKYVLERIRRKHTLDVFKKYVAPEVVDNLSKTGDFELHLGGEKRDVAVLFVDIRGFTPLSEGLEPEKVVAILNEYLKLTTTSILRHKGTLDKFIGDATMAVFNAPFDQEDYIYEAVAAAWDIKAGSQELGDRLFKEFGKKVGFGVGVNCGEAVVGNIGCDFRMDYTAIGDTVNTAARLESNAKAEQILISEDVYERLKDRIKATPVGEIPLKGKSNKIMVYSVDSI
jgi:adenylate cyclase